MTSHGNTELIAAVDANDLNRVDQILRGGSDSRSLLNEVPCDRKPLLASAHSIEMAEKLLDHGAEVGNVSGWWASGLFVNPGVDPLVGGFLVDRGAILTPHAAAGLGLVNPLRQMLDTDSSLTHARAGDGCTPLHFARNIETAALLIDRGAEVNARDEDHDSTPAQWLIAASADVAAFLLERGATADIFLATALGDRSLAEALINADRSSVAHRIGKAPWQPIGYQGRGGTILQWTLGFNCYAHQIAAQKGHDKLLDFLFAESDVTTQFLVACVMANRPAAEAIIAARPDLIATLPDVDLELPARYCWETNMNTESVRLMFDVGFPVDYAEKSHGFTPLHNAAWGGYGELVELLIERGHPVGLRDPDYNGTPMDWAIHCAIRDGRHPEGEYGRVVSALIGAGCPWDKSIYPTGHDAIDEVLRERIESG